MLHKTVLPFFFLLFSMIKSNEISLNSINGYLCQDLETRNHESDIFSDKRDLCKTNDEVFSCYSSDFFLASEGVIEIETNIDSSAECDALSVVVYERSEMYDLIAAKKDISLKNLHDDALRIYFNVTSDDSQGYILLFTRLSKSSKLSIKSIQFTPWHAIENTISDINIVQDGLDLPTTMVTIPVPTIGEIATVAPDTTIVTVPFPTIGQWPTATPIVTIPFPTVSNIATAEDTTIDPTTIVTVPFPTVGGIVTFPPVTQTSTDTTSTIVTIPFPTVGEIGIPETTPYPHEEEESSGLSTFGIVMTVLGSFAFLILIAILAWFLLGSKKSLDIKSNV